MEDPIKEIKKERKVRFVDSKLEDANQRIVDKKKQHLEDNKDKSLFEYTSIDPESDSDEEKKKKVLVRATKRKITKTSKELKTFSKSTVYEPIATENGKSEQPIEDGFGDFDGIVIKQEPVVKREVDRSIDDLANTPLQIQNFYQALGNQKGKAKSDGPIVQSYFVSVRACSSMYGEIANQYEFISNKMRKRAPTDPINRDTIEEIERDLEEMVGLSRDYEQRMMRTKRPGSLERTCPNGRKCEGYSMHGKVKTEHIECLNPDEEEIFVKSKGKTLPESVRPCILCRRRDKTIHFLNAKKACGSVCINWKYQDYYNYPAIHGQYLLSDCMFQSEKGINVIKYPVVFHFRPWYTQVEIEKGVWMYKMTGYMKPEEYALKQKGFCAGPSVPSTFRLDQ